LKIDFKCPNCQRTLRVASEHVGKKAKCPGCDTITLIEDSSAQEVPVAQQLQQPPQPQPASLFDSELDLLRSSNLQANTNPYRTLAATEQPVDYSSRAEQSDVAGVLSVVFGGVSFLSLLFCVCFSPLGLISLAGSIAGLVLSFYAEPPFKIIGMILNSIVLGFIILGIIAVIAVWIMAVSGAFDPLG